MKITINLPDIPKKREEHLRGVLVSLLDASDQILDRRRKASYLLHFFEERLTKNEKKEFSHFLKRMISSLHRTKSPNEVQLSGSIQEIDKYLQRFSSFGKISNPTTDSHQPHKARSILPNVKGRIKARILEASSKKEQNNDYLP